jgi:hypothetical protein
MTTKSAAATDVARRLWTRSADGASAPEEVAAAAGRMCTALRAGLARWIGAEGYRVLFERALVVTRLEHPALGDFSGLGGDDPVTTAAVQTHGVEKVAAGLVALVETLIELLGRIIGDEMAVRLVEQVGIPQARGVVSVKLDGGRDGRNHR